MVVLVSLVDFDCCLWVVVDFFWWLEVISLVVVNKCVVNLLCK